MCLRQRIEEELPGGPGNGQEAIVRTLNTDPALQDVARQD
jgi:hypothetical protein